MSYLAPVDDHIVLMHEAVNPDVSGTRWLSGRPRAHGFDRAVMRLSLVMMVWARNRSGSCMSADEHARARALTEATARREHQWAMLAARVR